MLKRWKKRPGDSGIVQEMTVYWDMHTGRAGAAGWTNRTPLWWTGRELTGGGGGRDYMCATSDRTETMCMPKWACDLSLPHANDKVGLGLARPRPSTYLAYCPKEGAMWTHGSHWTRGCMQAVLVPTLEMRSTVS